jgi:ubiquinone/menaquinone biosynthesis C-methylase UbiE
METMNQLPVCDYEGSPYQQVFWDNADRLYEDLAESLAIKALIPPLGGRLLELGAGAGRNTTRYKGFEEIVLLDYSVSQLEQARAKLGSSRQYLYVSANIYQLPFAPGSFQAATMIRTMHHMVEPMAALVEINRVLAPDAFFLLEYANKRNIKSILRFLIGRQKWNPFLHESIEFAPLNFDFHPHQMAEWLENVGFRIQRQLTISHFRNAGLKKLFSAESLARLDLLIGQTGGLFQFSPSVFLAARAKGNAAVNTDLAFQCPECHSGPLQQSSLGHDEFLLCENCGRRWGILDGIYNFHEPLTG